MFFEPWVKPGSITGDKERIQTSEKKNVKKETTELLLKYDKYEGSSPVCAFSATDMNLYLLTTTHFRDLLMAHSVTFDCQWFTAQ